MEQKPSPHLKRKLVKISKCWGFSQSSGILTDVSLVNSKCLRKISVLFFFFNLFALLFGFFCVLFVCFVLFYMFFLNVQTTDLGFLLCVRDADQVPCSLSPSSSLRN